MAKSGTSGSDCESEDDKKDEASATDNEQQQQSSKNDSICIISKLSQASTPISIVIQSLIKNLCEVYQEEEGDAQKLYNLFCNRLYQLKLIDESYCMDEFEGMRNEYQGAFHQLLTSARRGDNKAPLQLIRLNNHNINEWSHYNREFQEVSFIAKGGFGEVFKVRHRLDGNEYAMKKIFLRSEGIKSVMNYLSEVKTFASLNHSNIVQYKAAWIELGASTSKKTMEEQCVDELDFTSSSGDASCVSEDIETYIYPSAVSNLMTTKSESDTSDFQVSFEETRHISYSNSKSTKRKRMKRSSISEGGNAICTLEEIKRLQRKPQQKWATLFIQMTLCQMTLKQWLDNRNENSEVSLVPIVNQRNNKTVAEILLQLLQGLQYIHFKGIVHHDFKPSNIFMQFENESLLVQLGDFGLACPLQSTRHSLAFGTKLYSAPEQLCGKCDPKSDMYSLGIVFFELTEIFKTEMERIHSISELRKGNLPQHLWNQHPQFAQIITQLVVRKPEERPTAAVLLEILKEDVVGSEVVKDLQSQLAERDEEINRLRELLKTAGIDSP